MSHRIVQFANERQCTLSPNQCSDSDLHVAVWQMCTYLCERARVCL